MNQKTSNNTAVKKYDANRGCFVVIFILTCI